MKDGWPDALPPCALPSVLSPQPKPPQHEHQNEHERKREHEHGLCSPTWTSATSESSSYMASPPLSFTSGVSAQLDGGRKSSAGSSDLDEQAHAAVGQFPTSQAVNMTPQEVKVPHLDLQMAGTLSSPATSDSLPFEDAPNARHPSGKRYHDGYLQHRVPMAGGLLKSWKRKYFRLRDRGLVCYRAPEASEPLFEVEFTAHSLLVLDKLHPDQRDSLTMGHSTNTGRPSPGEKLQSPKAHGLEKRSSWGSGPPAVASLTLILKHVEVVGRQTPAKSVEVPIFLKAGNVESFLDWVECLRGKIETRKHVLEQLQVGTLLTDEVGDSNGTATSSSSPALSSSSTATRTSTPSGCDGDAKLVRKSPRRRRSSGVSAVMQEPLDLSESPSPAPPSPRAVTVAVPVTPTPVEAEDYDVFRARYWLMKEIGEGSFSIVHRAVNRLTGRMCAVKCCKQSPALEEEVRLLRSLSHPNVVGLEGVFKQDTGLQYVVLDYLKDGDLCDLLIERQRLSEPEACRIVLQVADGLAYLHRHCVLHRDIKPENILMHGRVVKIADLGLAKQLPKQSAMLKRSCGTLEYAAPELLCGKPYGLKSDVFSLGVVLYVLLFGAFPFTVESAATLQGMDRFPSAVDVRDMSCLNRENVQWHAVSPLAQDVLLRMLAPDDKDRISAEDLLAHPWFDGVHDTPESSFPPLGAQEDPEQARIEECESMGVAELLTRGFQVIKYGYKESTTPHATALGIDFAQNCITWTARRNPMLARVSSSNSSDFSSASTTANAKTRSRAISLNEIKEIREGHATDAFQVLASKGDKPVPPPELCLSIVCSWRTLDLVVEAASQRDFLARGLRRLLPSF